MVGAHHGVMARKNIARAIFRSFVVCKHCPITATPRIKEVRVGNINDINARIGLLQGLQNRMSALLNLVVGTATFLGKSGAQDRASWVHLCKSVRVIGISREFSFTGDDITHMKVEPCVSKIRNRTHPKE